MIIRTDFTGGINYKDGAEKLNSNEYPLLINGRVRDGNIVPIKRPRRLTGISASKFQGVYAVDNYLIVAADGFIYWRDMLSANSNFNLFINASGQPLQMNPDVDIHFQAVTASSFNWIRKADTVGSDVTFGALLNGSPAAIVIQDGLNQPTVAFPDGTYKVTQTYEQWNLDTTEYVPIGTYMYFDGVILYIVSPDGSKLYRSVSGKPLDFVVAIDSNGNKAANADESKFPITFGAISCIAPLYASRDFFVSQKNEGFIVSLDFNTIIFGEPYFNRRSVTNGAIAPYAFTTINGDSVFVANGGITSLNAIESTQTKGESAPFSVKIQKLFKNVVQDYPVAITFNDYGYFFVNTVFGHAIVVYDAHLQTFVSLDIDDRISDVVRFAIVDTTSQQKLILCTESGLYCYDDDDETAEVGFYFGDISMEDLQKQASIIRLRTLFARVFEGGDVSLKGYVDGKQTFAVTQNLDADSVELPDFPWPLPMPVTNTKTYKTLVFSREGQRISGNKIGFWLTWNFDAELSALQLDYNVHDDKIAPNQRP